MEKLRAVVLKLGADPSTVQSSLDPQPKQQIATAPATTASATATAPATPAEWAARLALLEKLRGQLTFSKAIAILLDLKSAEELSTLLTFENQIKRKDWHNSYAMGVDNNGNIMWGGSYRLRSTTFATETAIEQCAKSTRDSCKVVMLDGDFREMDFVEMAKRLGGRNIAAVRETYMQSLRKQPSESIVGGGGSHQAYMAQGMGYTSSRE
jgi:hypothetical protein